MKKILSLALALVILFSISVFADGIKFSDVRSTDWFNSTVTKLVDMGGIDGYPDKTFKPNNTITAEEFIKITVGSLGYNEKVGTGKEWAINYINKAIEIGLIGKGEFKETELNKPISRNKMAKILVKSVEHRKEELPGDYKEYEKYISDFKSIPAGYKDYVLKAYSRELIAGSNNKGDFKGESNLTRAEAATVIIRIFDKTERVNVKDITKDKVTDLRKVPIIGEGNVIIYDDNDRNIHNVDFSYMLMLDRKLASQYQDVENLLKTRFGENNSSVNEIVKYLKSKNVKDKELTEKRWDIKGQTIRAVSDSNSMDIDLTVWRDK